ncbi:hypothetical protein K439DRAFT_1625056 [Ramaria rubella]|nr:hypothetical protein K439DRAFT_1625056 [Ramaria rubella]
MPMSDAHYDRPPNGLTDEAILKLWWNLNLAGCKHIYKELSDTESDSNASVKLFPEKKKGKKQGNSNLGRLTKRMAQISGKNTVNVVSKNHAHENGARGTRVVVDENEMSYLGLYHRPQQSKHGHIFQCASGRADERVILNIKPAFNLVMHPVGKLSEKQRELKRELQDLMKTYLLNLTGLKTRKKKGSSIEPVLLGPPQPSTLPHLNADSDEYMNPDFTHWVDARVNAQIISRAAKLPRQDILENPFEVMEDMGELIMIKMLCEFSKITWRGWADRFKGQKVLDRMEAVPRFHCHYGFNPLDLLWPAWMSDEDSEPEGLEKLPKEQADEKRDEWECNMRTRLGIRMRNDEVDDLEFLEVTNIFHKLSRIHHLALKEPGAASRACLGKYLHVKNTGHVSDLPGTVVPYDIMISVEWWKDVQEEGKYIQECEDWGKKFKNSPEFLPEPPTFKSLLDLHLVSPRLPAEMEEQYADECEELERRIMEADYDGDCENEG